MIRLISRASLVWLLLMAAESVHGALRARFLLPLVGDFRSRQIGAIVGSAIILGLTYLCIQWIGAKGTRVLLAVGLLWLALTLSFEFAMGRYVFSFTWQRILVDYNLSRGGLLSFGMAFLLVSPLLASFLRSQKKLAALAASPGTRAQPTPRNFASRQ